MAPPERITQSIHAFMMHMMRMMHAIRETARMGVPMCDQGSWVILKCHSFARTHTHIHTVTAIILQCYRETQWLKGPLETDSPPLCTSSLYSVHRFNSFDTTTALTVTWQTRGGMRRRQRCRCSAERQLQLRLRFSISVASVSVAMRTTRAVDQSKSAPTVIGHPTPSDCCCTLEPVQTASFAFTPHSHLVFFPTRRSSAGLGRARLAKKEKKHNGPFLQTTTQPARR